MSTDLRLRTLVQVIESLQRASKAPELYRLTDYHRLAMYSILEMFCNLHNDHAIGGEGGVYTDKVGPYIIDDIDFDGHIANAYFFDLDFLPGFSDAIVRGREYGSNTADWDITPEAKKIALKQRPDPSDLEIEMIEPSESETEAPDPDEKPVPKSGYIGPYPMRGREEEPN